MREVADHLRGRLIFESSYSRAFQELSDDASEPDVRISRDRILSRIEWPLVCSKKGIHPVSSAARRSAAHHTRVRLFLFCTGKVELPKYFEILP
jgi:hypothetical protein